MMAPLMTTSVDSNLRYSGVLDDEDFRFRCDGRGGRVPAFQRRFCPDARSCTGPRAGSRRGPRARSPPAAPPAPPAPARAPAPEAPAPATGVAPRPSAVAPTAAAPDAEPAKT